MLTTSLFTFQILLSTTITSTENCNLTAPPKDAGEIQAHGVILHIYPRSHSINSRYNGCQSQWFLDEEHYRKLSKAHYKNGLIYNYDNININGIVAYSCRYENRKPDDENDKRCPRYEKLKKKTYQAGCFNQSNLNSSGFYEITSDECTLR